MIQKSIYAAMMTLGLLLALNESDFLIWNVAGTALFAIGAKALGILDKMLEPDTDTTAGATKKEAPATKQEKGGEAA